MVKEAIFMEFFRIVYRLYRKIVHNDPRIYTLSELVWNYMYSLRTFLLYPPQTVQIPYQTISTVAPVTSIAVVLHCHYIDLFEEMFQKIENIEFPYKLYVNTNSREKVEQIKERLGQANIPWELRCSPNRGRDMMAKYLTFRDVYKSHEYFLHLHDKKSLYSPRLGQNWRNHLLKHLLGNTKIIRSNLSILTNPQVGLVFPCPMVWTDPLVLWEKDWKFCTKLAIQLNMPLSRNSVLYFPIGGMTWGRSKVLEPLLNLGLQETDFAEEDGATAGHLHHALERMIAVVSQNLHYENVMVSCS